MSELKEQLELLKRIESDLEKKITSARNYVKGARIEQQLIRDTIKELSNHKKSV